MSERLLVAVDGGNAKTDLAVVGEDGSVRAFVRGHGCSPHEHGVEGALDRIDELLEQTQVDLPVAIAELLLAGVDFPSEVATVQASAEARGWAERIEVANDTFALLRAGTDRGWGIAVVCGAGINCLGVAPDGREARFPALGDITGDWGGGYDVGCAAVYAAARSEDGRGPKTSLERAVPAHFGLETPLQLAEAVHRGAVAKRRFAELAPIVLGQGPTDEAAAAIVQRLADEIVALVRVALERIGPTEEPVDVVLGGGVLHARDPRLLAAIGSGLAALGAPLATSVVDAPPVVGAALRALDRIGAPESSFARVRSELVPRDRLAEVNHG
jgi:N-acetylglucosamine kinase-like BadF-type ATPase